MKTNLLILRLPLVLLIFSIFLTAPVHAENEISPSPAQAEYSGDFWNAFFPKFGAGFFGIVSKNTRSLSINPMIEMGIEKGWTIGESYFLSVDLMWTVFIPDSFQDQRITISNTVVAPWVLLITPIPHIQFGYRTSDQLLISIGPAYLWGLTFNIRKPVWQKWFLGAEATWFIDRAFFNTGLHDFYLNAVFGVRL